MVGEGTLEVPATIYQTPLLYIPSDDNKLTPLHNHIVKRRDWRGGIVVELCGVVQLTSVMVRAITGSYQQEDGYNKYDHLRSCSSCNHVVMKDNLYFTIIKKF